MVLCTEMKLKVVGKKGANFSYPLVGVTGASALTALLIGVNDLRGKKGSVSLTNGGADLGSDGVVSF